MVDLQERVRLRDAILSLIQNTRTWDDFDRYYCNLNTEDRAVRDIAYYYWMCFDPEYPVNQQGVTNRDPFTFRAILFLLSGLEYSPHTRRTPCEWWPFILENDYTTEFERNSSLARQVLKDADAS